MRNKAKRMARKDLIYWVHQQLQQDPSGDHSAIWKTMKNQNKGFVGKKSHFIVDGKPVPWSKPTRLSEITSEKSNGPNPTSHQVLSIP